MALYKEIIQGDGVKTHYHRILYVQVTTNHHNSVAVLSYVGAEARSGELAGTLKQPYQQAITYETDYDPAMTVEAAYEYLKTRPEFAGAEDV
jgi:hypothetical protein